MKLIVEILNDCILCVHCQLTLTQQQACSAEWGSNGLKESFMTYYREMRAHKLGKSGNIIHGWPSKVDEMSCICAGANFLLKNIADESFMYERQQTPHYMFQSSNPNDLYPYLLVNWFYNIQKNQTFRLLQYLLWSLKFRDTKFCSKVLTSGWKFSKETLVSFKIEWWHGLKNIKNVDFSASDFRILQ